LRVWGDSRVESLQLLYLFEVQGLFSAKPLTGAASIKPENDEIMEGAVEVFIKLLQYRTERILEKIGSGCGFPGRVCSAKVFSKNLPGAYL
jgi:hypothetical protein